MTAQLDLDHITVQYGDKPAVHGLSLRLQPGEIGCLLGPSGCGKTTVLRAIAGFEHLTAGQITLMTQTLSGTHHHTPAQNRGVGMVFQDYGLFPHLTVQANIALGLHQRSKSDRAQLVAQMLDHVGLRDLAHSYPNALSGGQQQRVALARALAPSPRLLLLDEPFSNLDAVLRERLSHDVRELLKSRGTTALLVTHDQNEAFAMADRVGLMREGALLQWGTPYRLYHQPANQHVADFIGEGVMLMGRCTSNGTINTELGELVGSRSDLPSDTDVHVLLRPDDVVHDDASLQQARVCQKAFRGAMFLYTLALPSGTKVLSLVPSHHNHAVGESIGIRLELDHLIAFPMHAD